MQMAQLDSWTVGHVQMQHADALDALMLRFDENLDLWRGGSGVCPHATVPAAVSAQKRARCDVCVWIAGWLRSRRPRKLLVE